MERTTPQVALPPQSDVFTWAYIDAAIWSSTDDEGVPLDMNYDATTLAPETLERMKADCASFQVQYWEAICGDLSRAGHDFWLTRNHHGAGFWDGDWPEEIGEELTEACNLWGDVDLSVGQDGKIHTS
jgi:hypothetical protein